MFKNANFGSESAVFTLVAVAEDWAGNIVKSAPVAIGIGDAVPPDEPPPEPEETGEEGSEGTDAGDESGDTGAPIDGGEGCACAAEPGSRGEGALGLLLGLGLLGLRRRSE